MEDVKMAEFALGELFSINSPKKRFNANSVKFGGRYPYVARGASNNGIRGYITEDEEFLSPAKSLSFGQDTATVFYQPDAYFTGDKIKVMVLNGHELTETLAQFFVSTITKAFSGFAWGQSSFNEKVLKSITIPLPVHPSPDPDHAYTPDDIDWEYMERIAELEAYLKATGLDDCALTPADEAALAAEPPMAEFRVGDVFGQARHEKYHSPNDLITDPNGYLYICASNLNNGINKDMPRVNGDNLSLTPEKIIAWGKQCPKFCMHDERCVTSQGMYYFDMVGYSDNVCQYVCAALSRACSGKYSYSKCLIGKVIDEETISLPVHPAPDPDHAYTPDDIDWEYMERFIAELEAERIAELEAERIAELEAYLKATGLDDCELTDEDKAALACEPPMAEFRVGDVFGQARHEKYHSPNDLITDPNGYLYICASNLNNGINKDMPRVNGDNLSLTPEKIIAWGKQCPKFCMHDERCVTSQGMYYFDMVGYSDNVCQYVCAALSRACSGKYSYSKCLIGKVIDEETISLPVRPSPDPDHAYTPDDIDWEYMERFIRAVEKQVMADVVAYKDEVIATTKRIVGKEVD